MKLVIISVFPPESGARYMLAGYQLKAYLELYSSAEVVVLDFPAMISPEILVSRVRDTNPDVLGFSVYTWNVNFLKQIAPLLRQELGEIRFICGGPEVSPLTMKEMGHCSLGDFFIEGEGESALMDLLASLENGENVPVSIPGVSVWHNGLIQLGTPRAPQSLETVPSPYLSGAVPPRLLEKQQAFIETQRGCRNRCRYCLYHKGRPSISYFSMDRVTEEIKHLIVECKVSTLRIMDPIFTSDISRAKVVLRLLAELKTDHELPWCYWEFMCHDVDEEFLYLASLLKDRDKICNSDSLEPKDYPQHYSEMVQGYKAINCFGIQSFHVPSLKAVQRPAIIGPRFSSFMENVRKYNLLLKIDLILGLPEETSNTFRSGLDFLLPYLQHTDHILNIHRLQVLPGTDLENIAEKYELKCGQENSHFVGSTSTMSPAEMDYLSRLCGLLFRVVNSPLRECWFQAVERSGKSHTELLSCMYDLIKENSKTNSSRLATDDSIDDLYWNNDIFREISSSWLQENLSSF